MSDRNRLRAAELHISFSYLHDEKHRRRILAQLNKSESLHALRRKIFFANLG